MNRMVEFFAYLLIDLCQYGKNRLKYLRTSVDSQRDHRQEILSAVIAHNRVFRFEPRNPSKQIYIYISYLHCIMVSVESWTLKSATLKMLQSF